MSSVVLWGRQRWHLLQLTRGGLGSRRKAASGGFAVEGMPLVVKLFQAEARGIEPADGFRLEEIEQARARVNGGLILAHVADGPNKLNLPGGVSIEEAFREALLRFFTQPKIGRASCRERV